MDTEGNWCLIYREHCWLWAPGRLFPPLLHPAPTPGWPWEAVIELWLFLSACHGPASPVENSSFSFISGFLLWGGRQFQLCGGLAQSAGGDAGWLPSGKIYLHRQLMPPWSQKATDAFGCQSQIKTGVCVQYRWPTGGSLAMSTSLHLSYLAQEVRIQTRNSLEELLSGKATAVTIIWRSCSSEGGDASLWVPPHLLLLFLGTPLRISSSFL